MKKLRNLIAGVMIASLLVFTPTEAQSISDQGTTEVEKKISTGSIRILGKQKVTIYKGTRRKLKVKVKNANASKVVWFSKNKKIVSVNKNGNIKGKKKGSTYVYAILKSNTTEKSIHAKVKVSVKNKPKPKPKPKALYSASEFKSMGVIYWDGWRWTWYSQRVLPGGGLSIPGRHVDENGYICDKDDYICIASSVLKKGTVIDTPFGKKGKVYDCGCASDTVDVYTDF